MAVEPISAVAGAAITVLKLAESITKLFRKDRKVELVSVNEEAATNMKLFLGQRKIVSLTIDGNTDNLTRITVEFLNSLSELKALYANLDVVGNANLDAVGDDNVDAAGNDNVDAAGNDNVDAVRDANLDAVGNDILDAVGNDNHDVRRIEACYWLDKFLEEKNGHVVRKDAAITEHLEGLLIATAAANKQRLVLLDVKANILQTIESKVFRSKQLYASAQVQVKYQIYQATTANAAANAVVDDVMLANKIYLRTTNPVSVQWENSSRLRYDFIHDPNRTDGDPIPAVAPIPANKIPRIKLVSSNPYIGNFA
jgi:hypothetical protein